MPRTDYDHFPEHIYDDTIDHDEHAHYVGVLHVGYDHVDIGHGKPAIRTYALRGDWYAVHTH